MARVACAATVPDRELPSHHHSPSRNNLPLLLSVPHAGRDYPLWLSAAAWGGKQSLEPLEDPLVDRLAWRAIAAGHEAIIARCPRAAIDCNRAEEEIDPSIVDGAPPPPPGSKARAGLGLIPSRTPRHGRLWRQPIDGAEVERRLNAVHRPYHAFLDRRLREIARDFGSALLLDLHSMPPRPRGASQAQVVIGDRFGTSAAPWLSDLAMRIGRANGFSVSRNEPFAGGHIVARHGRPDAHIHAIQIEIDRTAYCLRDCRTPGPGFERVARLVETLATGLGDSLAAGEAIAAE
jgi:N-formylglutamate amidohydrolase